MSVFNFSKYSYFAKKMFRKTCIYTLILFNCFFFQWSSWLERWWTEFGTRVHNLVKWHVFLFLRYFFIYGRKSRSSNDLFLVFFPAGIIIDRYKSSIKILWILKYRKLFLRFYNNIIRFSCKKNLFSRLLVIICEIE